MDAAQIIDALGGRRAVADLTGAEPNAITQWRRIGVPAKYWPTLVERASALGVEGITFASLRCTKPAPASAA